MKWYDKNRKVELTVWIGLLVVTSTLALFMGLFRPVSEGQRQHYGCIVLAPPPVSFLHYCVRSPHGESRNLRINENVDGVNISVLLDHDTPNPRYYAGKMSRAQYRKFWQAAVMLNAFDLESDPYPRTNATECILSIRQHNPWRSTTVVIDPARMSEAPYSQLIALMDEAVARTPMKQANRVTISGDRVSVDMTRSTPRQPELGGYCR